MATAERDALTGAALQKARQALLGYLAAEAARTDHDKPGRLPCPESLASIGTANEGQAASNCSNVATTVGRLPWGTLGIDQLRDGYGEPLWLVISPGFRGVTPTTAINFATPAQLTYNDVAASAVAVIIAPGRPLNTVADPAALPARCPAKVDQNSATRNTAPLVAANFIECGNATGSYRNPGTSQWSNDRAVAITAAEWADAIAPGVADRLQRQVAPAMQNYYNATSLASWGQRFFPNASTFTAAPPTARRCAARTTPSPACRRARRWSRPPAARPGRRQRVAASALLLSLGGCAPWPNSSADRDSLRIHSDPGRPRHRRASRVSAPRVGYSFRYIDTSMIMIEVNGPALALPLLPPYPTASTGNYSGSVNAANGRGSFSFDVNFPALSILETVRIRIPVPSDALLADARSAWFVNNGWDRFTYYAVSQAASHDPTRCGVHARRHVDRLPDGERLAGVHACQRQAPGAGPDGTAAAWPR